MWPTWLQHVIGLAPPLTRHALAEDRLKSTVPYTKHKISTQEVGNALATLIGLRVSMDGGDNLLYEGSYARLSNENAI
ncbi:hypothetical protein EVAR_94179_1 [Eumeta japonica]|uniref:Uncharacterized protein n=1 Tax=Eumeta variegata TaxID=151549 RepID=A0A4C1UP06_EUMVA|nr:hypothetical protein EVAR_94179_1 [Eumeta japonica]